MRIRIISVGKASDNPVQALQAEYEKRLRRWATLEWQLIPHGESVESESRAILQRIKPNDFVVLLDERGQQFTSEAMAQRLEDWMNRGKPLVFVIGGAFGVDQTVQQRADLVWSFSDLVFPHQLMRVLLAEQVYRMFGVLDGSKYHHK